MTLRASAMTERLRTANVPVWSVGAHERFRAWRSPADFNRLRDGTGER